MFFPAQRSFESDADVSNTHLSNVAKGGAPGWTTTQYTFAPGTYSNAYTYDAASNRTSLTAPDGSITTYGYDTLNRLNGLANTWAGSFGFGYDALSRRTSLTRPNGVNTSYGYDSVSRLLSVLHQVGSTTLDGASYTYDNAGNRTSKTNYLNGITENYTYDLLYELTQVTQGGDLPPAFVHAIIRQFVPPGLRLRTAEPAKRSRTQPPSSM